MRIVFGKIHYYILREACERDLLTAVFTELVKLVLIKK